MHVVLWDTRKVPVVKDLAGGFGAGPPRAPPGAGRWFYGRYFSWKRWPAALTLGYLAAAFQRRGHRVHYAVDRLPPADLYVFHPALVTLDAERRAMLEVRRRQPGCRIWVVGPAASAAPEIFAGLPVTVLRGEPEQMLWKFDEVLEQSKVEGRWSKVEMPSSTLDSRPSNVFALGRVEDLDRLPPPDWTPFHPGGFRIGYDFWRFPTALIQSSRGCTFSCAYCPYLAGQKGLRLRDPGAVVEEIRYGRRRWGFRSFKFRDPLFGQDPDHAHRLAEGIARLPGKIQFSVETRAELLPRELLRALKDAGLCSVTVGAEAPDARRFSVSRARMRETPQHELIETCRRWGIRTVASFIIGFPEDDEFSIRRVARYARELNPTFANFNLLTPYPGTEYFARHGAEIADFDFTHYTSYLPVMQTPLVLPEDVRRLHARCIARFYNRWRYLRSNASLLWPVWQRFATRLGQKDSKAPPL
ncbi:MAG: radical SAM protein [Pirellulales bacterium]|nr:radical SAM protein [Pirellulales bacterium]